MAYFITGGTGFIGRFLVANLLRRGEPVHALVREGSQRKLDALRQHLGASAGQLIAVVGDLGAPDLGVSKADAARLKGRVTHFFHVAAVYDLNASAAEQEVSNIEGTRSAVRLAQKLGAGCFHHVSSIAAAGFYDGVFREDMFEQAVLPDHPYFRTKYEAERIVRRECAVPFRIYRPSGVVGHSETGEIDKIDGAYYFFKPLQKLGRYLPAWMPLVGIEGGQINLVPVNYVADAMDHIAHRGGLDGGCFHLTDPASYRVDEAFNTFARAAAAPQMRLRIGMRAIRRIPERIRVGIAALRPVRRITDAVLANLGIPRDAMMVIDWPTRFDSAEAARALEGSGIKVPALESYAGRLWDYWERHLDPDRVVDRARGGREPG